MSEPETVICTFRVRADRVDDLLALRPRHHETLRRLQLITDRPTHTYLGEESDGPGPVVVDIFEWVDGEAAERAHGHPEIAALWEQMEQLCEARHGRRSMDFPHFQPVG
ncbi:MAG: hypothetical protein OES57_16505 [Acidimicrobiia bacterium]|nr:hypothetical protein [Acidimicrobiia bacterium]